jgi:hypothetical protein
MSYYQLSEDQEFAIYETRNAMNGIMHIVDAVPVGKTISLSPEEASALLSLLAARLPKSDDMTFVSQ